MSYLARRECLKNQRIQKHDVAWNALDGCYQIGIQWFVGMLTLESFDKCRKLEGETVHKEVNQNTIT
jgi:hypothetical protein